MMDWLRPSAMDQRIFMDKVSDMMRVLCLRSGLSQSHALQVRFLRIVCGHWVLPKGLVHNLLMQFFRRKSSKINNSQNRFFFILRPPIVIKYHMYSMLRAFFVCISPHLAIR